jgi:hypothetical protein
MTPIDHLAHLGGLIQVYLATLHPVVAQSVARDAQTSLDAIKAALPPTKDEEHG